MRGTLPERHETIPANAPALAVNDLSTGEFHIEKLEVAENTLPVSVAKDSRSRASWLLEISAGELTVGAHHSIAVLNASSREACPAFPKITIEFSVDEAQPLPSPSAAIASFAVDRDFGQIGLFEPTPLLRPWLALTRWEVKVDGEARPRASLRPGERRAS